MQGTGSSDTPRDAGDPTGENRRSLLLLFAPFCLATLGYFVFSHFLETRRNLLMALDECRPNYYAETTVVIEKQLYHLECVNRENPDPRRVIPLIGTSGVVNGIDPEIVNSGLQGGSYHAENFGMTSLFAYELPLLKRVLIPNGRQLAVYFYHGWSFQSEVTPSISCRRSDTGEAYRLLKLRDFKLRDVNALTRAVLSEACLYNRYQEFFGIQAKRIFIGKFRPQPYPWDFRPDPPDQVLPWPKVDGPVPVSKLDQAIARWHVQSDTLPDNVGWRGMDRFLQLAHDRGIKVFVIPFPQAPQEVNYYGQLYDIRHIDDRVSDLCQRWGAGYVQRCELPPLTDEHFYPLDFFHPNTRGRKMLSKWLTGRMANFVAEAGGTNP